MVDTEKRTLSTGREWYLTNSREKDPRIIEGTHLILGYVGDPPHEQISSQERDELLLLAVHLAQEHASEPGRWRIDFNGPAVAHRPHFHVHIKLPAGADQLDRLAG